MDRNNDGAGEPPNKSTTGQATPREQVATDAAKQDGVSVGDATEYSNAQTHTHNEQRFTEDTSAARSQSKAYVVHDSTATNSVKTTTEQWRATQRPAKLSALKSKWPNA